MPKQRSDFAAQIKYANLVTYHRLFRYGEMPNVTHCFEFTHRSCSEAVTGFRTAIAVPGARLAMIFICRNRDWLCFGGRVWLRTSRLEAGHHGKAGLSRVVGGRLRYFVRRARLPPGTHAAVAAHMRRKIEAAF